MEDQLLQPLHSEGITVSDGLDEEEVPLSTPGNRNTTDITRTWVLEDKGRTEYFIPSVLCFVFKSIGNVSLPEMHCSVLFTMVMKFDCSELNEEQKEYVIENIRFRIDEREIENKESMKPVWRGKVLFCTYRSNDEEFYFHPDLSRLPFDKPILDLKFEMTTIENKKTNESFRFNCILVKEVLGNSGIVTVKEKCDRIPEYNLALSDIEITRPMEAKVDPKTKKWLFVYYPTMVVHIPLYREPENLIFSVVMPLWVLNLFTLSVFLLEGSDFATKLSILVTIILAVFAFTFVVRSILPQVPYITDLENQILISLLVLFVSGIGSVAEYLTADESMLLTKYISGGISVAIVVIAFLVFVIQYAIYKQECNKNDQMNEEYYFAQRAKMQSQSTFEFTKCVGPGYRYPPRLALHHLSVHHH